MEYCKNGEGVDLERMIQYYSLQILCVFVAELFKDTHTKKDHTNKQNFFRGKNAKMLIYSHSKNRKWHTNYLSWQTNKNRERYNLIINLIFWHFLDAVQVILSI